MKKIINNERISLLKKFFYKNKHLPSYRELGKLFNFSSPNSATRFYRAAIEEGLVIKSGRELIPTNLLTGLRCYNSISAGFPSPAEDELCDIISIDEYLIENRESSFLVKVTGDSMIGAGIMPGDLIIVDRGKRPFSGDIVIAEVDGEWTLKFFIQNKKNILLRAANPKYSDIKPKSELKIGGVVTGVIRSYRKRDRQLRIGGI